MRQYTVYSKTRGKIRGLYETVQKAIDGILTPEVRAWASDNEVKAIENDEICELDEDERLAIMEYMFAKLNALVKELEPVCLLNEGVYGPSLNFPSLQGTNYPEIGPFKLEKNN